MMIDCPTSHLTQTSHEHHENIVNINGIEDLVKRGLISIDRLAYHQGYDFSNRTYYLDYILTEVKPVHKRKIMR